MTREELFETIIDAGLEVDVMQDFYGAVWLKFAFDENDEEDES